MRIWLLGNVYDFEKNTLEEVRRKMVDLLSERKMPVSVGIKRLSENEIKILLFRKSRIQNEDYYRPDYICELDQAIIDGRWAEVFTPHYGILNEEINYPLQSIWNKVEDFIDIYKRNVVYYDATPIDSMSIICDAEKITLNMKAHETKTISGW